MLIVCPNCGTAHDVPGDFFASAATRKVRCGSCREIWPATPDHVQAPASAADAGTMDEPARLTGLAGLPERGADAMPAPAVPAPLSATEPPQIPSAGQEILPPDEKPAAPRAGRRRPVGDAPVPMRRRRWPAITISASLLVLFAFVALRNQIVRAAPQSARLYAAIGLPINLRELEIADVSARIVEEGDARFLIISGTVANPTGHPIQLPSLRLSVRNPAGAEVYSWTARLDAETMPPGEVVPFKRRLASPPAESAAVEVRFLNKRDLLVSSAALLPAKETHP